LRAIFLSTASWLALSSTLVVQSTAVRKPDFTGRWVLAGAADNQSAGVETLPVVAAPELLIAHGVFALTVEHPTEKGTHPPPGIYRFLVSGVVSSSGSQTVSSVGWHGNQLVISTKDIEPPAYRMDTRSVENTQTWSLHPDGTLTIEFSERHSGILSRKSALRYRRAPQQEKEQAEAPLYQSVLVRLFSGTLPETLIIESRTIPIRSMSSSSAAYRRQFDEWPAPLIQALTSGTVESPRLLTPGLFPKNTRLIPRGEIERVFERGLDGWDLFPKIFHGARSWQRFSHPVFTRDELDAVVYYEHSCGSLCGQGAYIWFHRDRHNLSWRINAEIIAWMS